MTERTEAFRMITADIEDQAGLVTNQIQAEVRQMEEEEIEYFTVLTKKETENYREREIGELKLLQATKTSQAKLKINRDLLGRRQAMAAELFDEVRRRLQQFAAGEQYAQFLEKKLQSLPQLKDKNGTFVVRKEDEALMGQLLNKLGYAQPVQTGDLPLGGFRFLCPEEGFEMDETLENAVKMQKEWFQNHSGFTL